MRDALVIEDADGERWQLALTVLREGTGHVRCGVVELSRRGPGGAGPVVVAIDAAGPGLHHDGAEEAIAAGLAQLKSLREAGPQLEQLMALEGVAIEYVHDYGDGAVTLGSVQHGQLAWAR